MKDNLSTSFKKMKLLLEYNGDVAPSIRLMRDPFYLPYLHILNNDIYEFDRFLEREEDMLIGLHLASFFGRLEIMEKVIKKGFGVNSGFDGHIPPLHFAVMGNQKEAVKRLIDFGADISSISEFGTVGHIAIEEVLKHHIFH